MKSEQLEMGMTKKEHREYLEELEKCNANEREIFEDIFHLKFYVKGRTFDDAINSAKAEKKEF